jgi:hypothetical protein
MEPHTVELVNRHYTMSSLEDCEMTNRVTDDGVPFQSGLANTDKNEPRTGEEIIPDNNDLPQDHEDAETPIVPAEELENITVEQDHDQTDVESNVVGRTNLPI